MSSTERAPEPTMEEILASIRRIISEDEGQSPQQARRLKVDVCGRPGRRTPREGIADTQIIADIERVLAGASGPAELCRGRDSRPDRAGAAAEDLSPDVVEELAVIEVVEEISIEPAPAPTFAQAFPPEAPDAAEPEAPAEPVAAMEPQSYEAPHYVAEEPQPAPAPSYAPPEPLQATPPPPAEDPTAALERAIAALKAGDLAAFAREAIKQAAPAPSPWLPRRRRKPRFTSRCRRPGRRLPSNSPRRKRRKPRRSRRSSSS